MRLSVGFLLLALGSTAVADGISQDLTGHTKFRLLGQFYPDDSVLRQAEGADSIDLEADLRLNYSVTGSKFSFNAAYQLFALHGDNVFAPNDDRRLFDLTATIDQNDDTVLAHRLDRLSIAYSNEKTVLRIGRQALSWGNGLFYAPMDLVNPFNPAAIDTEFKTGDDMLYLQYLRDNGDDIQGAVVFRRDIVTGNVESRRATTTLKYHGFAGDNEYDVLLAESYDDRVFGIGAARGIGGAVVRADLVLTDTPGGTTSQLVANASYAWIWGGRNVSAAAEYYFNGFGLHDGEYGAANLASNPELAARLARGELFALGRHYLAGSLTIEMTPLWTVTPVLLSNMGDPSALLQLTTSYSLSDNMSFLGSINLPIGANGSEYGGIPTPLPGQYLSVDWGFFAQLAWYF